MGLYVQTLENMPPEHSRDYYIYLLDYGWKEPLGETLFANFDKMASLAAKNNAVIIRGLERVHFEDEVLSWHNINGENAEELLPAILITNRHPFKFREFGHRHENVEKNLKLILIPLKRFCKTTTEVTQLIEKLFRDIINKKDLSDFKIAKEILKENSSWRVLADEIILQPNDNIQNESFNFQQMIGFLKKDEQIENLKLKISNLQVQTRTSIENGLSEFNKGNYISSARILFPAIEEIVNQMLITNNENPNDRNKFKGLSDKLNRLEELGIIDKELIEVINITKPRNSVLHGNFNPKKQELARPLCYSSITFLTELIA